MAFGFLDALTAAASLAATTVTMNPLVGAGVAAGLSGGKTALRGGDLDDIAKSAAMSGAMSGASAGAGALGGELAGEVGKFAAPMAMNAGIGALRGQSLEDIGMGAAQGLVMKGAGAGIHSLRGAPSEPVDENTNSGFAGGGEVPRGYTQREVQDLDIRRLLEGIKRTNELDDRYERMGSPGGEALNRYSNAMQALTGEGHNTSNEAAREKFRSYLRREYGDEKLHNERDPDLARANYMGFASGGGVRRYYEDGGEVNGGERGGGGMAEGNMGGDGGGGWGGGWGGGYAEGNAGGVGDYGVGGVGDYGVGGVGAGWGGDGRQMAADGSMAGVSDGGGGLTSLDFSTAPGDSGVQNPGLSNSLSGGVSEITGNPTDLNATQAGTAGTMTEGIREVTGNIGAGGAEMGLANGVSAASTGDFNGWSGASQFAPAAQPTAPAAQPVTTIFGGTPNYGAAEGDGHGSEGSTSSMPTDMTNAPDTTTPATTTPAAATVAAPTVTPPTVSPLVRPGTINPDATSPFGYNTPRYLPTTLAEGGRVGLYNEGYVDDVYGTPWTEAEPSEPSTNNTYMSANSSSLANSSSFTPTTSYDSGGYYPVGVNTTAETLPPPESRVGAPETTPKTGDTFRDASKGKNDGKLDDKATGFKGWWKRNEDWAMPAALAGGVGLLLASNTLKGSNKGTKRKSSAQLQAENPEVQAKPSTIVAAPAGYRPGFSPEWNYIRYAGGGRVGMAGGGEFDSEENRLSLYYPEVNASEEQAYRRRVGQVTPYLSMGERLPRLTTEDTQRWDPATRRGEFGYPVPYDAPRPTSNTELRVRGMQTGEYPQLAEEPPAVTHKELRDWSAFDNRPYPPATQSYTSREDRDYDRQLARSNTRPTDRPATQSYESQEDRYRTPRTTPYYPPAESTEQARDRPFTGRGEDTRGMPPITYTRPSEDRDERAPKPKPKAQAKARPRAAAPKRREMTADDLNAMSLALSRSRSSPEDQGRAGRGSAPAALRTYYGLAKGGGIGKLPPPTQQPGYERAMDGRMVMDDAERALNRNHPDPENAIARFRQYYGDDALATLMKKAKKGDGMSDSIPARIDNRKEAALSSGEYVIPADVVSHLGNGSSDAGTRELDLMNARVRKARTGSPQQGKGIRALAVMPR